MECWIYLPEKHRSIGDYCHCGSFICPRGAVENMKSMIFASWRCTIDLGSSRETHSRTGCSGRSFGYGMALLVLDDYTLYIE
jgi:hypothetical protein